MPLAFRLVHRTLPLVFLSFVFAVFCLPALAADTPKKEVAKKETPKKLDPASGLLPPKDGWPEKPRTGNLKGTLDSLKKPEAWFYLTVPANYNRDQAWPLVIVLHGGPNGRPDDLASVFRTGLAQKGVISIFPNALDSDRLLDWNYPHCSAYLLAILREVSQDYRIDPTRIYLVGHSMGGGGVWVNGAVLHEMWAGLVPMSGWYNANPAPPVEWLAGLPVYCMHGAKDPAVPAERSRMAFADLKRIGSSTRTYTEFTTPDKMTKELCVYREIADAGHDIFNPWAERGSREVGVMVTWLLAQKRSTPADIDAATKRLAQWGAKFHWKPEGSVIGTYADAGVAPTQTADAAPAKPATPAPKTEAPAPKADAPAAMTPQEKLRRLAELMQQLQTVFKDARYAEAVPICEEMIKIVPDRPDGYYNLACAQARLGKTEDAFVSLGKAVETGTSNVQHVKTDPDLESLHADKRFDALLVKIQANADSGAGFPLDRAGAIAGVKTVENVVKDGFRYRLRMDPAANKQKPNKLIVWLHPSGGYGNNAAESLAPMFIQHGYALIVLTQKNPLGWSGDDYPKLWRSIAEVGKIEGIDANRPILFGFSAGGQAALYLWGENPGHWGGLILDAAYPVDLAALQAGRTVLQPIPKDDAVKTCPVFSVVGEKDGGSAIWRSAVDPWTKAGIPLEMHYVPDQGHAWLFDAARKIDLDQWLTRISAPTTPAPVPTVAPDTKTVPAEPRLR